MGGSVFPGLRGFRAGAAVLFAVTMAVPASGQAPEDRIARYAQAMKKGAAAAARRDFGDCVEEYQLAHLLAPDAEREALANGEGGLCEEAWGRPVPAYDLLRLALEKERGPAGGGGRGPWKRFSEAAERLERRVARALLVVSPGDAEVRLDGDVVGYQMSGRFVTVSPGRHTWTARREGYEDATFTHVVRGGDLPDVRLALVPRPKEAPAPPCDAACREAIRAEGEREGAAKARAQFDEKVREVRREVRATLESIYRRRVDPSLSLIAGGALSAGLTLDVGPGFFLGGEARWRKFDQVGPSVALEVQTLLPTKAQDLGYPKILEITQVVVAAVPCVQYKWFSGCVFGDVGMLIGGGPGPISFEGGDPVLVTAGFGPRLGFQIPFAERFMVRAFAELRISPIQTGFIFYDEGTQWDNPLVTGLFGIGISFGQPVQQDL